MKKILKLFFIFILIIIIVSGFFIVKNTSKKENVEVTASETDSKQKNTSWTITQYGKNDGGQMMGYTIEGNVDGLIIVDGGYYDDEDTQKYYEDVIKKHNNVVDAWILTHYDVDHAGAFLSILDNMSDLQVKKLYTQGMPDIELAKEKAPWDEDWSIYERYLTEDLPYREVTKDGFEVNDIIGLRFKVLSVYDSWMNESLTSLLNSGSMIFKLYGNDESIMYCADVTTNVIEENILKNYKDDIPSDYIQIAHHGNSVFSKEFYELVNPKVAFFDAPDWLYNNVNNVSWYTIQKTAEMFKEWNVDIYNFSTTPNSIVMK